jgi:uncharacterized membrane protein YkoI
MDRWAQAGLLLQEAAVNLAILVLAAQATEGGQLVYRIRLLSADRSRVWTVSVDARTGRIN